MMKHILGYLLLFALLLQPSELMSQRHSQTFGRNNSSGWWLSTNYSDSLRHFADSLYREGVRVAPVLGEQDIAPLFLPVTFYKNITRKAFGIDDSLTTLDKYLLNVYLNRPDMVSGTQSQLEKSGPTLSAKTVTEKPKVTTEAAVPQEPQAVPVDVVVLKPNFWTISGDYYLQFLQNYVSGNWHKGGESNYSMVASLVLEANYNNKSKVKWDNKLEMKLGFQTSRSDTVHKLKTSTDMLRYTGKLGLQASKKWYYTLQLLAYSQFMRNFKTNQVDILSDFMSPLDVNASIGMDYTVDWFESRLKGTVHLAPLAYNFRYVDRLALSKRHGLEEGKHALHDIGSLFTVDLKWKFSDNINWQTRLYGYTTFKRMELEWENTLTFQFNKYISTKLFIYPRFDDAATRDNEFGYWQLKEYTSLGFSYSF